MGGLTGNLRPGTACCSLHAPETPIPTPNHHSAGADGPDGDARQAAVVGSGGTGSSGPMRRPPPRAPHPKGTEHDTHALPRRGPAARRCRAARRLRWRRQPAHPGRRPRRRVRPAARPAPPAPSRSAPPTSPRPHCSARSTPRRSRPRASTVTRQFNIGSRETYLKAITGRRGRHRSPSTPARCSTSTTRTPRSCSPTRSTPRSEGGPAGPHGPRQVRRRGQELPGRHQADRRRVVAQGDPRPRRPPGRPDDRCPAGVQDPSAGPRRPEVGLQHHAQGVPAAAEPGDGRGAEERPGQGGQHLQHRPVDRGQRLRRAR